MVENEGVVEVRILSAPGSRDAKWRLSGFLSPGQILEVTDTWDEKRPPITLGTLFGLDHDEVVEEILDHLEDMDAVGVKYQLFVEGEEMSRDMLLTRLEQWKEIEADQLRDINREMGLE